MEPVSSGSVTIMHMTWRPPGSRTTVSPAGIGMPCGRCCIDITPSSLDDFTHTLDGTEERGGVTCWKVTSVPKNDDIADENGYSKRVSWYGQEDFVVRASVLYDLDGDLHKELSVSEVRLLDPAKKRYRATHLEMVNKQNGRRSVLTTQEIQLREDVPDDYFTTRYLERQ